ncbi:hypothetical protein BASA81_003102 [Batrachochytrium salamandrivorans]|nr:hypothetical protein BASA81_003102 [Batrachochytrium salamandrivorans]
MPLSPSAAAIANQNKPRAFAMSWKRIPSPAIGSEARPMKRVNSKEDCRSSDGDENGEEPRSLTFKDIDTMLKNNQDDLRERAMAALMEAHCSETLACLFALFQLEEGDGCSQTLIDTFVIPNAEMEIALPTKLRTRLLEAVADGGVEEGLNDLKAFVLSDLRFNPALVKVLLFAGQT